MKSIWYSSLLFFVSGALAQDISSNSPIMGSTEATNVSENTLPEEQQKGMSALLGSVIDQSSREPIANARVTLLGTKFSAITSVDGQYKIESIPDGVYQLKAEADGYEPQIINNIYLAVERKKDYQFFTLKKTQQEPDDFVPVEKQPQPISGNMPPPIYPEEAKNNKLEGTVWVKIWIDKTGSARKAVILKSDAEIFNQPSIDAAMKWQFTPAMLKDQPVDVWVSIPFKFKLHPNLNPEGSKEIEMKGTPLHLKSPERAKKNKMEGTIWVERVEDETGKFIKAFVRRLYVKSDEKKFEDVNLSDEQKKKISKEIYFSLEEMKKIAVEAVMNKKNTSLHLQKDGKSIGSRILIPVEFDL